MIDLFATMNRFFLFLHLNIRCGYSLENSSTYVSPINVSCRYSSGVCLDEALFMCTCTYNLDFYGKLTKIIL